jgi:hypothetical protein
VKLFELGWKENSMKLRMALVAALSVCISVPALSQEFAILSGTITGAPVISASGWSNLGLKAIETSGANLGNEIKPVTNGPYQMALFPGIYDFALTGNFGDFNNGQYTSFETMPFTFIQAVTVTDDTTRDFSLPLFELTGVVTDTDGTPIPNVRLEYSQYPNYGYTTSSSEPGSEGTYKLFFVPGAYNLKVSAPPAEYPPFEIKKLHILGDTVRTIILSYDYSVLNEAIVAISQGLEVHFDQFDVIDEGQAKIYEVPVTASRDQLELIVNWEGSEVLAQVFGPNDSLFDEFQSQTPPIAFQIANPAIGAWKVKVTAIEVPYDNYPIAIVAGIAPNAVPVADTGGPYSGSVGEAVVFDASGSSDLNGQIVRYEWDWNYDGSFDQSLTSPTIARTWTAPYDGWIQLRVTDNEGAQAYAYAHVKITHSVDLSSFAANFGRSDCASGGCAGNFDGDGDVDGKDIVQFIIPIVAKNS